MSVSAHTKHGLIAAAVACPIAARPARADNDAIGYPVFAGVPPAPPTVKATSNDGSADNVSTRVSWREIDLSEYAQPGTFVVTGTVEARRCRLRRP